MTDTAEALASTARLPEEAAACRSCGIAVLDPDPSTVERFNVVGLATALQHLQPTQVQKRREVTLARCETCQRVLDAARALLNDHPRAARAMGSRDVAEWRLSGALAVFDLLGMKVPQMRDDRAVLLAVDALAVAGIEALWSRQYVPLWRDGATPGACAAGRWAHVSTEMRSNAREAAGSFLRRLIEQPRPVPCPAAADGSPQGCLVCGVAEVMALPSLAARAWMPRQVTASNLGRKKNPNEMLSGHLCPACSALAREFNSVGPSLMERSIIRATGWTRRSLTAFELGNLKAWAVSAQPPVATPWAWCDLKGLRRRLERASPV